MTVATRPAESTLPRRTRQALAARRLTSPSFVAAAPIADTYGWDTVFAIHLADVNRAIEKGGSTPAGFHQVSSGAGMTVTVDGTFGPWQIVPGGDGQNLHMAIPIPALTYNDGRKVKQFDSLLALAEVRLTLLPQPDRAAASDGGQWMDLRLRASVQHPPAGAMPAGSQPVYVLDLEFKGQVQPEGFEAAIIQDMLGRWLQDPANLQSFNHVFASVNLNARAAVGAFQWLMPTHVSYAVVDQGTFESSVFALLCMTEGRDADGLAHQVSPFVIPDGHRSGMLISNERFLSKMLLPGIGVMFTGPVTPQSGKVWPKDYFAIDPKESTITNLADINIEKFQVEDGGELYTADLGKGNLRVRLQTTYLETQMIDLHHRLNHFMSWLHVYHTINSRSTVRLTEQIIDLLPGGGTHLAVVTKDKTAEWVEIGLLAATLVAMSAFGAAKGIGTIASRVASTTATEATVTAEVVVDVAPTAAQSAAITTEGSAAALSGLRGGVVQASKFLEGMQVAQRASLVALRTGAALSIMQILEKLADEHFQSSMPKFQEFVAGMMTPVAWPAQQSGFTVEEVFFSGSFQIGGDPGFAV